MMRLSAIDLGFNARCGGMEMTFDKVTQQQHLAFHVVCSISIPELLDKLAAFQRQEGRPDKVPVDDPGAGRSAAPRGGPVCGAPAQRGANCCPKSRGFAALPAPLPSPCADTAQMADAPPPGGRGPGHTAAAFGSSNSGLIAPAAPFAGPPARDEDPVALDRLLQAVQQGSVTDARAAIRDGANVNAILPGQTGTALHLAMNAGGRLDMVSALINSRSNVNAVSQDGKSPLHLAIAHHSMMSPMVPRLLLSSQADINLRDGSNITPLDCAKVVVKQAGSAPNLRVKILLHEVTERPTVAVCMAEKEEVLGAQFADLKNDKIAFFTETSVGLFSLVSKRVLMKKSLNKQSSATSLAVNPCVGTIILLVGVHSNVSPTTTLVHIWPSGQLHDEEPLKLSIMVGLAQLNPQMEFPQFITCSTSDGPLTVVSRLFTGKVLCWPLHDAAVQITAEHTLAAKGGPIAISSDGNWIAVAQHGNESGTGQVDVWNFGRDGGGGAGGGDGNGGNGNTRLTPPRCVCTVDKWPQAMAVIQQPGSGSTICLLAISEHLGHQRAPIEVLAVSNGDVPARSLYKVRSAEEPCRVLSFCHQDSECLIGGFDGGLVLLYSLPRGRYSICHDDIGSRSICCSVDRSLIVTAVADCFRVHRLPPFPE